MKLKFMIPLGIFLVCILFFYFGLKTDPNKIPSALLGKSFPEFNLPKLSKSNEWVTKKIFLDQVSILNVWASWCQACYEEHETFLKIFKNSSDKIKIYGLNYKDQGNDALKWLNQLGNPYHAVIEDRDGMLAMDLGVYGVPETFIIDQKGVIRFKYIGPISEKIWKDEFLPKIAEIYEMNTRQ